MKHLLSIACISTAALFGATQPEGEPYDADLFWKDKRTVFANVEGLAWTVSEGALDYAIKQKHPSGSVGELVGELGAPAGNSYANGRFHNAGYTWSPGFRISSGWCNAPHYWDFYLQYTYFRTHGNDKVHSPDSSDKFLNGTWPQPDVSSFSTVSLKEAHSHLHFRLDLLELMFTRRYHPNPHLRLKIFAGPAMAWVAQDWKVHYRDTTNNKSTIKNDWQFTGAGIRIGGSFDWYFDWYDLYITGLASMKVLAGGYHNHAKQTSTRSTNGEPIRNAHLRDTRLTFVPQVLAGPSWQKRFKSVRVEAFAGYELCIWTNLQEVYRSSIGSAQAAKETWLNHSVVAIQGVSTRLTLEF